MCYFSILAKFTSAKFASGRGKASRLRTQLADLKTEHENLIKHEKAGRKKGSASRAKTVRAGIKRRYSLKKDRDCEGRKLEVDLPEEAEWVDAYPGWIRA